MKQMMLLKTASYDPKKKRYYVDISADIIGEVWVNDNDIITRKKGFGYQGQIINTNIGKEFVEEWFRRRYQESHWYNKDGSQKYPLVVVEALRPKKEVTIFFEVSSISQLDACLRNLERQQAEIKWVDNGKSFYATWKY